MYIYLYQIYNVHIYIYIYIYIVRLSHRARPVAIDVLSPSVRHVVSSARPFGGVRPVAVVRTLRVRPVVSVPSSPPSYSVRSFSLVRPVVAVVVLYPS